MPPKGPKKPPLTHFLCIPLINSTSRPILEKALSTFKSDFVSHRPASVRSAARGVDTTTAWQSAVRPVGTLHLTLGVMSLRENARLEDAVHLLAELELGRLLHDARADDISATGGGLASEQMGKSAITTKDVNSSGKSPLEPLIVSLRSLHPMQTRSSTAVLYAAPHDVTGRLVAFCERLRSVFTEKGFIVADGWPLKLHATIVNTTYARLEKDGAIERGSRSESTVEHRTGQQSTRGDESGRQQERSEEQDKEQAKEHAISEDESESEHEPPNQHAQRRQTRNYPRRGKKSRPLRFDAGTLMEKYDDFTWAAEVQLDRIAICEMGAKKIFASNGDVVDEAYREVAIRKLPA